MTVAPPYNGTATIERNVGGAWSIIAQDVHVNVQRQDFATRSDLYAAIYIKRHDLPEQIPVFVPSLLRVTLVHPQFAAGPFTVLDIIDQAGMGQVFKFELQQVGAVPRYG